MHLSEFMICQLASSQLKKNKKLLFLKLNGELPPPPPLLQSIGPLTYGKVGLTLGLGHLVHRLGPPTRGRL